MSIQPLPQEVIAQIKSSIAITSLNSVICELFKNSLDARATRIDITVNQAEGACIVEDDGCGILPFEFKQRGGLGKLYHSSKLHSTNPVHGRLGTFIASLSAMSVLIVVSHHQSHRSHNMITMHKSEVATRQTPTEPKQHLTSFSHGTRVTVRDLFGNMPVRVKQRALMAEKQKSAKDWDELKHDVVALLLAWPERVSVTIRDSKTNLKLTLRSAVGLPATSIKENLSIPLVCSILSQSSFILPDEKASWIPVGASTSKLGISGTISLLPSASKHTQFISYGIQPLKQVEGNSILHDEVNRIFANSAFGNDEEIKELGEAERQRRANDQRFKGDSYTKKELKGAKKRVDRWPMYYINIQNFASGRSSIRFDVEEILGRDSGDIGKMVELLQAMILQFLTSNNFRSKAGRGQRSKRVNLASPVKQDPPVDDVSNSPAIFRGVLEKPTESRRTKYSFDHFGTNIRLPSFRSSISRPDSTLETWSRGKSGLPSMPMSKETLSAGSEICRPSPAISPIVSSHTSGSRPSTPNNATNSSTQFLRTTDIMRRPFEDVEIPRRRLRKESTPSNQQYTIQQEPFITQPVNEESIKWINPITKSVSFVNKRTGLTVPMTKPSNSMASALSRNRLDKISTTREPSFWISSILKTWINPTFAPTEPSIPQIQFEGPEAPSQHLLHGRHHHCTQVDIERAFKDTATGLSGQISKSALRDAEIISQVDKKFVLVKLTTTGGEENNRVLALIDQHAADERIRIESLMEELCALPPEQSPFPPKSGVLTAALSKPLIFEISSRDVQLLLNHRSHFVRWGIMFQPKHNIASRTDVKGHPVQLLTITHLPPGILERCNLDPGLLLDMIRTEVHKIDQQPSNTTSRTSLSTSWLERIHSCPQGLVDMLNSRACRSAIMFNDWLSNAQCEMLVGKLSKCIFPFQCAHGRPSLVPLVDIGQLRGMGGLLVGEDGGDFMSDIKRWKQSMNKC